MSPIHHLTTVQLHLCGVSVFSGTAVGDESQYVEKNVPTEK